MLASASASPAVDASEVSAAVAAAIARYTHGRGEKAQRAQEQQLREARERREGWAACSLSLPVRFYGDAGEYAHGGKEGGAGEKGRAAQGKKNRIGFPLSCSSHHFFGRLVESAGGWKFRAFGRHTAARACLTCHESVSETRGPERMGPRSRWQACGWYFGLCCSHHGGWEERG